MPGSWSGHSMKSQKEFLKLRLQEDISSIWRITAYLSQVITQGLVKTYTKASLVEGQRALEVFLY
jgi:hypothetical protein